MKANHLLTLILLSGLMASCSDALYRTYPKAERYRGETAVPGQKERKTSQIIVRDEALIHEQAPAEAPTLSLETASIEPANSPERVSNIPDRDQLAMDAVPVNDDTLEVDAEEHEFMIYQAEKSEDLVRQLQGWAVVTIVGWFLFPLFFIGLIGGVVTILRYNNLTYVSEKSIRQKRRAQRFFLTALIVPLVIVALIVMVIYLSF